MGSRDCSAIGAEVELIAWLSKLIVGFVWNIVDLLMYKEAFPCFPLAIYKLKQLVDYVTINRN